MENGPLAIGGVGGSGTRVVAEIARSLGVFLGDNLNSTNDNLDFPGLSRIINVTSQRVHPVLNLEEVAEFERIMTDGLCRHPECALGWGWKNPPNFLYLKQFAGHFKSMRYVHVIRHGLDMALSRNTWQVRQWGHLFGVTYGAPTKKRSALRYWIKANDFTIEMGPTLLGERFMLLNFDDLCHDPARSLRPLIAFLGVNADETDIDMLSSIIVPPSSLGRSELWRHRGRFTAAEASEVARFGFDISVKYWRRGRQSPLSPHQDLTPDPLSHG